MLGKLTLQGQVQRRLVKESDQRPERGETGAVLFFWDRTVSMRECLKEFFLDLIYAAVILRAINEPRFGHLQVRYETNLLTHLLYSMPLQCRLSPNSGTPRKAVCRFIHDGSDEPRYLVALESSVRHDRQEMHYRHCTDWRKQKRVV